MAGATQVHHIVFRGGLVEFIFWTDTQTGVLAWPHGAVHFTFDELEEWLEMDRDARVPLTKPGKE